MSEYITDKLNGMSVEGIDALIKQCNHIKKLRSNKDCKEYDAAGTLSSIARDLLARLLVEFPVEGEWIFTGCISYNSEVLSGERVVTSFPCIDVSNMYGPLQKVISCIKASVENINYGFMATMGINIEMTSSRKKIEIKLKQEPSYVTDITNIVK